MAPSWLNADPSERFESPAGLRFKTVPWLSQGGRALWEGQRHHPDGPWVNRRAPPACKRRGRKVHRPVPTPQAVAHLLEGLRRNGPALAMVALIVGCGLLEGEALRLRSEDLNLSLRRVRVHGGAVRGKPGAVAERWVELPGWAWDLLWRGLPGLPTLPVDGWVFPSGRDPSRPRGSFRRTFQRAAQRMHLPADPHIGWGLYAPVALRRLYQVVARGRAALRSLVRGTATREPDPRSAARQEQVLGTMTRAVASAWPVLAHPPGGWSLRQHVPRRPPKEVGALEPETTGRWTRASRAPGELPWNCRPDVPPELARGSQSRAPARRPHAVVHPAPRPASDVAVRPHAPPTGPPEREGDVGVTLITGGALGYLFSEWTRGSGG